MAEHDRTKHDGTKHDGTEAKKSASEKEAPGEVRHTGQAVVRLVLFAVIVLMLAGLAWALVRMASRPAPATTGAAAGVPALEQPFVHHSPWRSLLA